MSPIAHDAVAVLGQQVRLARQEAKLSRAALAERAGVSVNTVAAVEHGKGGVSVAIAFNVAVLAGVPLFGLEDPAEAARLRRRGEERLALLPQRVRAPRRPEIPDDF